MPEETRELSIAGLIWRLVLRRTPTWVGAGQRRIAWVEAANRTIFVDAVEGEQAAPPDAVAIAAAQAVCQAWEVEVAEITRAINAAVPVAAQRNAAAPDN